MILPFVDLGLSQVQRGKVVWLQISKTLLKEQETIAEEVEYRVYRVSSSLVYVKQLGKSCWATETAKPAYRKQHQLVASMTAYQT